MNDGYVGKLVFVRVYSGNLAKGSALYNPRTGKTERISRLLIMKADSREDINVAYSGDICAIVGARDVVTGDTLCTKGFDVRLEPPTFPEPVISMSIEPKTTADQEKMATGLQRLAEEDPTFFVSSDEETGQTIIAGMGELHLEIIKDRLFREFKVGAEAGRPQIAYRETVSANSEGRANSFAKLVAAVNTATPVSTRALERGAGIEIVDKTIGGVIPKEFIQPPLKVSAKLPTMVLSVATQWLILKSLFSTAPSMMWIPLKCPSRWLVSTLSVTPWKKLVHNCLSP